jgi:phospholipid/cholesterol/gamma-HCH transport system permease protein
MGDLCDLGFGRPDRETLVVRLAGTWRLRDQRPSAADVDRELARQPRPRRLTFDTTGLGEWDTGILTFLLDLSDRSGALGVTVDRTGLPPGIRRLLALATAVPEKKGARKEAAPASWLTRVGEASIGWGTSVSEALAFVGELTRALARMLSGRARYQRSELVLTVQQCGAQALPIVTLISFLVGLILAFVGAVQLEQFGAAIYVANLVGIAIVRDMGAMMTAIVMAGRTGASFAAQLGTMKVTQEIDAFVTMGISPMEFLVLPRVVALTLMMPLLCLYSDVLGILGGAAVSAGMLNVSWTSYYLQTADAVTVGHLIGGLVKATVYGVLIALSGCLRGLQCGGSASAVGDATTAAVVTSIVLVITACGIFAVVFYVLGL